MSVVSETSDWAAGYPPTWPEGFQLARMLAERGGTAALVRYEADSVTGAAQPPSDQKGR